MILHRHDNETITKAFKEWMKTSAVMPAPSDIFTICERLSVSTESDDEVVRARDRAKKREEARIAEMRSGEPMSEEEFKLWYEKSMAAMKPESKKLNAGKCDTKHFDRLSEVEKKQMARYAIKISKTVTHGNPFI
jgi:hypothetical protein